MLLSLLLLVACVFGFKQSLALKQAQDQNNKQGLELILIQSQYKHNLKTLSQYQADLESKNSKIQVLNNQIKELQRST